jgi:protein TonB
LLAVRFVDPEGFNRTFKDTPLEVILVNAASEEAREGPGAGTGQPGRRRRGRAGRATSPLPPVARAPRWATRDEDSARMIEQMQDQQQQLLAQMRRELAAAAAARPA